MDTAAYVRISRKELGITQADLAEKLGVARTTLVAIERGQRKLRANELMTLRSLGFPDMGIQTTEAPHTTRTNEDGERWMWLSRTEQVLLKAFRAGSVVKVLRLALANKDARREADDEIETDITT